MANNNSGRYQAERIRAALLSNKENKDSPRNVNICRELFATAASRAARRDRRDEQPATMPLSQIDNYLGFSSFVVPEEDEEEGTFFADIKRMKVTPPKDVNLPTDHIPETTVFQPGTLLQDIDIDSLMDYEKEERSVMFSTIHPVSPDNSPYRFSERDSDSELLELQPVLLTSYCDIEQNEVTDTDQNVPNFLNSPSYPMEVNGQHDAVMHDAQQNAPSEGNANPAVVTSEPEGTHIQPETMIITNPGNVECSASGDEDFNTISTSLTTGSVPIQEDIDQQRVNLGDNEQTVPCDGSAVLTAHPVAIVEEVEMVGDIEEDALNDAVYGPQPKPLTKQAIKKENHRKRQLGEAYTNYKGIAVEAKNGPREVTCKCPNTTCHSLSQEQIIALNSAYWASGSYAEQRTYILGCIRSSSPKSHKKDSIKPRRLVNEYYFRVEGEEKGTTLDIKVCRTKFLAVLNISKKVVQYAKDHQDRGFAKKDARGRRTPKHALTQEKKTAIMTHIPSFPKMESHYCRSSTSLEYLDQGLSISFMHKLYKLKYGPDMAVSYSTYRKLFRSEFNLSFHKPKKDQCNTCTAFKNLPDKEKEKRRPEYDTHIKNKDLAQHQKEKDKETAKGDPSLKAFTFDLEAVLYTPYSQAGTLFYKRKLCSYNLTIYDQATGDGECNVWNETDGKRGSCEIGSCLWKKLVSLPAGVTKVSLTCDSCGGQNRNRFIAALLLHAVRTLRLERIDLTFLESGHTYMECDSMHSCIETAKKRCVAIYSPKEWPSIMRGARKFKRSEPTVFHPFSVNVLSHESFYDLKDLKANTISTPLERNTNNQKVNWMFIKRLAFVKDKPDVMLYKTTYEGDDYMEMAATFPKKASSSQKKRGRPSKKSQNLPQEETNFSYELVQKYDGLQPISEEKKKDLMEMCEKNLIPADHHAFFVGLPVAKDIIERLPEPDVTEEDEDGPGILPEFEDDASDDEEDDEEDSD